MDAENQRQCRHDDVRLSEWKRQKRAAIHDARVSNQQRMASRRALECIGMPKARLVFRYEISDCFFKVLFHENYKTIQSMYLLRSGH